jgi:hypothetical protein
MRLVALLALAACSGSSSEVEPSIDATAPPLDAGDDAGACNAIAQIADVPARERSDRTFVARGGTIVPGTYRLLREVSLLESFDELRRVTVAITEDSYASAGTRVGPDHDTERTSAVIRASGKSLAMTFTCPSSQKAVTLGYTATPTTLTIGYPNRYLELEIAR